MIDIIVSQKKCTACGACLNICAHNAIKMTEDKYGYLIPYVDTNKCIECGLCVKICPINSAKKFNPIKTYGASWDNNNITKCASGGIFGSMATYIIQQGGIAFGCSLKNFNGEISPIIRSVNNTIDLQLLLGSKYIQSNTLNTFNEVKKLLKEGKTVLYSGTPCQIAGLKCFLRNKEYPNLITIDFICHGTPNARIFQSYINYLEEKNKIKIEDYKFRDKTKGWGKFYYSYTFRTQSGKIKKSVRKFTTSIYYRLFLSSTIYRDSCYSCQFANPQRVSDITIGDFWGIEKEYNHLISNKSLFNKGISCVIINTNKGLSFWENTKASFTYFPAEYDKIIKYNHQLKNPSQPNNNRQDYLNSFVKGGYKGIVSSFYKKEWISLIKELIFGNIKLYLKKLFLKK